MKMRKIIAVLSCLLMLCSLLPLAAISVSAAEDVVYSADFESGLGTWKSGDATNAPVEAATPPIANPNGGSLALKQTITNDKYPFMVDGTPITLEANTDYVMSFDTLATNAKWPVQALIGTNSWFSTVVAKSDAYSDTSATEWKTYSFEFNSGSNTKVYVGVKCTWTNTTLYFDNIKIVKKAAAGGDEGGETTSTPILNKNWSDGEVGFNAGSVVAQGPDGSNCFKWDAAGNWSSTSITVSPVETGEQYVVSFKAKAASASGVFLTFQDTAWYSNNYFNETVNVTTEWKEYSVTTDIGRYCKNGSIYVKFQDTGAANTFYVDDLTISKVVSEGGVEGGDDYSDTNLIVNGDFEKGSNSGWSVHNGTTVTEAAAMNGKYGLHCKGKDWAGIANQTITVTNGQAYKFSFWYYIVGDGFNYKLTGTSSQTNYKAYWPSNKGEWTKVEVEFIATDDSQLLFNLSGYNGSSAPDFYVDDVVLVEMKSPSNDGYIVNGDLEVGTTTGWNIYQQTKVSKEAAYKGDYGLVVKGNGGWGGLLNQSFKVQAEREYILRFAVKAVSQGINIKITDDLAIAAGDANAKLWGIYYNTTQNGTEWKEVEYRFYTGNNTTATFGFVGSGTNGAGDEIWIDNVSIEKVGGEDPIPNNNIVGGQNSVSEDINGLAFRFQINGSGAQIEDTNAYINGSAKVKLYKDRDDLYTLVKAGAIVTNNMTVGKGDMTLANVDGKKTIDIEAKYLCEVNADSFAFAVRVVGIPEANLGTNIFARPYFVYEDADGNEIVEYGSTKSENYNHAANPKASIKLLAIGNSFSQDAINNHLYEVLESAGYEEIILGNMYIGGCSLDTHWANMKNGSADYTYYYRSSETNGWRTTYNQTLATAMAEEEWDYITIQQVSGSSGKIGDYGNLDNALNWINDNKSNPNAKILWHMTWAYDEVNQNSGFANYGNDQMTMYRMILDTVNAKVASHNLIDGIIPSGTSIQNMRTSSKVAASSLCESDGYHLSAKIGDYIAALTWYAYLSGDDVSYLAYQPGEVASFRDDINASVNAAIENPYKVTKCASYDTEKSIKVLSIGHSFSVDVMGTYLYQMLEQAGYEDITIGYLYYPGCQLSRHWEYISTNTNGHERYGKNESGTWVTKSNPYAIDVLRDEDWDYVTLQVSPDYVGGDKPTSGFGAGRVEYDYLPLMIDWIQENALNANVDIKFHQIWAYSEGCDLWSYTYHDFDQQTMYNNIIDATQQYVATNEDITGIIPCGTAVQNGRALLGDIFNMPDATQGGSDGYHLNEKYGDFLGSLTWACFFSGVDAHTITARSAGMTEAEFSAIADAVNAALADWTQVTVG